MKKKFVYRKLEFENQIYYQLYKILNVDDELDVSLNEPGEDVEEFYKEVRYDGDVIIDDFLYTQYLYEDGNFTFVSSPLLFTKLNEAAYNKFKDFDLVPKNDLDVKKLSDLVNGKIIYQEESTSALLNTIKSNLDILDADISREQKVKLKHNILMYGPKGFGKSTFMNMFLENTTIPCAIIELTNDPEENVNLVISGLGTAAMGNIKRAENGVVFIKDNFDDLSNSFEEEVNPLVVVEELVDSNYAILGETETEPFDLSKITYVLELNTPSNSFEDVYDQGFANGLYEKFTEAICFPRLSKEEIKRIILANPESPLNIYKKVCQKKGKKLIVKNQFLDTLIKYAYYDVGGIELINDYIEMMIKRNWSNEEIILDEEMVKQYVEDSSYLQDYIEEKEKGDSKKIINQNHEENLSIKKENSNVSEEVFRINLNEVRETYKNKLGTLMEYIKGQDEPLKNILYHSLINDIIQKSDLSPERKKERINHILIRGGAGTGKSYITGLVAKALDDKPFAEIDCKRYTEAGFVGKSIDDMLIKLYYAANGNLQKAQKGILFLDEIDKLARGDDGKTDVSRGAVQESLLKMMEGTVFDLEIKEGALSKIINFDTRELSIIGAGAFEGLKKIREKRLKKGVSKAGIGFQKPTEKQEEVFVDKNYTLEDMQEFGMDAQLLRRISYHCDLNELSKDDYRNIMLNSKSSAFKIKLERISMLGVKITYDEEFIDEFANKVSRLGFGVSGISILTERIFSNFETKLLENDYDEVILTKECVTDPSKIILVENKEKVLKKQLNI